MPNIIWWILGLAAISGSAAFYYSDTGKKIFKRDACISDLPDQKKKELNDAIKSKDLNRLNAFTKQAEEQGWSCVVNEIKDIIKKIESEPKCPTDEQISIAVKDIESGKLRLDDAEKLVAKLDVTCKDQKSKISTAIEDKRKSNLIISKDKFPTILIADINASVVGIPEPDKSVIVDILKESKSTSDLAHFKYDPGKILSYADVAAKYKASKAESNLRDLAAKVKSSISDFESMKFASDNDKRASVDWPAIMSLPDNDLSSNAKAAARCVHPIDEIKMYDAKPGVKLNQAIPGCAINVDKLVSTTSEIETKYGSVYSEAISELKLIINSLKHDLLT